MKNNLFVLFLFVLVYLPEIKGQPVYKIENDSQSLSSKFESIFEKADQEKYFWIGYSIIRNDERSFYSGSYYSDCEQDGMSLRDIIENSKKFQTRKSLFSSMKKKRSFGISFRIENGVSINKGSDKETALLFLYDKSSKTINEVSELSVCSFSDFFDLQNYPLYWLGETDIKTSFDFISGLFVKSKVSCNKKELLPGIGIHTTVQEATSLLIEIAKNKRDREIRKSAIFWLGLQNNSSSFSALKNFIYIDKDFEINKSAILSLGFINIPEAIDELINIARHNNEAELRKQAVYGLGNIAVNKAEEALKNIIEDDPDIEIKKHAVYALANGSNNIIPYLINIAKTNRSLAIRKCAIYSLGNFDEKEAVDALIGLAKN